MKTTRRYRLRFAVLSCTALISLLGIALPLGANSKSSAKKFDYRGDLYFQSFYITRDLPLERSIVPRCSGKFYAPNKDVNSRCREEEDFHRIRFRLNTSFRASPNVDILYNLEVGFLTFGRDQEDLSGPGSGGQGSGRTNLETQQLYIKLKNDKKTASLDLGIFSFDTPSGIVLASSGGGGRFKREVESWNSIFELIFVRSLDKSRVDGDSNGFSDDNYRDVHLSVFSWKYSGIRKLRAELYGVYLQDDDYSSEDETSHKREISRVFWGGLYLQFKGRLKNQPWKLILHAIGNGGTYHRPHALTSREQEIVEAVPLLDSIYQQYRKDSELGLQPKLKRKRDIAAAAGEAKFSLRLSDRLEVILSTAAGSGRLGREDDGRSSDERKDQFRTAAEGYQFSEITLDSSGGYSLLAGGKLTGIHGRGLALKARIRKGLVMEIGYFDFSLLHAPAINRNLYYRLYEKIDKTSGYYGAEWNVQLTWTPPLADMKLTLAGGYFNAGAGYKILNDAEYGDTASEVSLTLIQKF